MTNDQETRAAPVPVPEERKRVPNPQGVPVRLHGGQTWVLAYGCLSPTMLALIDDIYDKLVLTDGIPLGPAILVAWRLMLANYSLKDDELNALFVGDDEAEQDRIDHDIAHGVIDALFGSTPPRRTWSTWALSSLYANGIEPNVIPTWLIPEVLAQLVLTGRAVPKAEWIDSTVAQAQRSILTATLQRGGVQQRPIDNPNQGRDDRPSRFGEERTGDDGLGPDGDHPR